MTFRSLTMASLGLAFVTLAVLACLAMTTTTSQAAEPAAEASDDARYVVYYLHGARRCKTCRSIEAQATATVHKEFASQLDSGLMDWRVLNFEEKENKHFVKDFGLFASSVVVAEIEEGQPVRFEVLQDVWKLHGDDKALAEYVKKSISEFMAAPS